MNYNITYSLFKNFVEYKNENLCGNLFYSKYIQKDPAANEPDTDEQLLGQYFEYLVTGYIPHSKEFFPTIKSNPTFRKLLPQLEIATEQARLCKELLDVMEVKVKRVNYTIEHEGLKVKLDILGKQGDRDIIIDTKFTSKLNKKWDENGWHPETLHLKELQTLQAVHYSFVFDKKFDKIPLFQFWVFHSKNLGEYGIFQTEISPSRFDTHKIQLNSVKRGIEKGINTGFKFFPSRENCQNCPISFKCSKKTNIPKINLITIN